MHGKSECNFIHNKYGYCYYNIEGDYCIVYNLYIHEEFRGRGHGRGMLEMITASIRRSGYSGQIEIEAIPRENSISKDSLIKLYESFGFTVINKEDGMENNFMEQALEIAAQCWCEESTSDIEMNSKLATVFAEKLAMWMETAAQNQNNTDYYRGLVVECGEYIGEEAYIQDDGGVSQNVLCAKVPELVKELVNSGR